MNNSIPVTWSEPDVVSLPFVYRCEFENTLNLVSPQDKDHYQGRIGLYHYNNNNDIVERFGLADQFDWLTDKVYAVHSIPPGHLLPNHSDNYATYCQRRMPTSADQIVRVIVFLQAWQPGHILQIGQQILTSWHAGEWASWTGSTPHLAANLGHTNRYTLQITGLKKEPQ